MNFFRSKFSIILLIALLRGNHATSFSKYEESSISDEEDPSIDYRLPKSVIPEDYFLYLRVSLEEDNFNFNGSTQINATIHKDTDTITLHVGRLNITKLSVFEYAENDNTKRLNVTNHMADDKPTEKYNIFLASIVKKGTRILLLFEYKGDLSDTMTGFYRSSYFDANGRIKHLASTQFQTTHARHAFPCFDEPSFKARFTVVISKDKQYRSISNMPLQSGTKLDIYQKSIPMSTYLVAFVISDFDYLKSNNNLSVHARSNAIEQARYALNIGEKSLKYLSKLFNQDYQLPKMDMVAVPDFSAGAMENWGLVTYRESRMLYDKNESSAMSKQTIASVIVHELAHMWFGNMVTPEWWSYLWLSEGFARYYQYFGTAKVEPSWQMEDQFVVEQHQTALATDGLESSQSLTREVSTPSQIGSAGDTITYNKGASVIRMMNHIFGSNVFDEALRSYLNNNKIGRPEKLWSEFQKLVDTELPNSVDEIMSSWTNQSGFPVVNVTIKNGVATAKQSRFLLRNLKDTPTNILWWIPITWASQRNPDFENVTVKHWMNKTEDTFSLDEGSEWFVLNVKSTGFYRVNYDKDGWNRIIKVLNSKDYKVIHLNSRTAILDDLLNLARTDWIDYDVALNGLRYLVREKEYLPFKAAFNGLTYLNQRFTGHDSLDRHLGFKKFFLKLINETYDNLGYVDRRDDNHLTILLRNELNKWACNFEHSGCVSFFNELFQKWKKDITHSVPPNLRPVAYCTGIRHGSWEDWNFLWKKYKESNFASDQEVIAEALGCTLNTTLMEKYLSFALGSYKDTRVRKQDSTSIFSAVYKSSSVGAKFVLDFTNTHLANMVKYYDGYGTVSSILSSASRYFSTIELVKQFEELIRKHDAEFKPILKSLKSALDIAKYELEWYKRHVDPIDDWIKSFNEENPATPTPTPSSTPSSTVTSTHNSTLSTTSTSTTTSTPNTPTKTTPSSTVTSTPTKTPTLFPSTPTSNTPTPSPTPLPDLNNSNNTTAYRLPLNIYPTSYLLVLYPHFNNFSFDGIVHITAKVVKPTKTIVLHSSEINHIAIAVREIIDNDHPRQIEVLSPPNKPQNKYDFLEIELAEELSIGQNIKIEVNYNARYNEEMRGFYLTTYTEYGQKKVAAATHLEPTGARKLFPCFDEPALKATFTIKVRPPSNDYKVISNMPLLKTDSYPSRTNENQYYEFQTTPKMSTYLVAIVVAEFKSQQRGNNISYGVWSRPNFLKHTTDALSFMEPLEVFFAYALNQSYWLPKLDMVALPDFSAGAMENWGLMTFKERNLLYDPEESTNATKQSIANIISHEISHQWFGNLVTPYWWKYIWLSEGFARYFQYFATARMEVGWNLESQFVVDQLHSALSTDSSLSSHALTHDVYSPSEIRGIFDTISYAKGASVIRMMEKSFGRDAFYESLQKYLENRKLDHVTPENLFDAFDGVKLDVHFEKPIHTIMNTWTTQPGYPILNVSVENNQVHFSQERFLLRDKNNASTTSVWYIPITWVSTKNAQYNNTKPVYWLTREKESVELNNKTELPFIFNVQQSGFYRVNYNVDHWERIIEVLKGEDFETIHEINRASLIDDLMNLARAGQVDYKIVLSATRYLAQENNYIPWRAFFNGLTYLHRHLQGKHVYDAYKRYATSLLNEIYERLGFEDRHGDSHTTTLLRMQVRKWACKFEMSSCKIDALKYFDSWKTWRRIPPNYRGVAFCEGVKENNGKVWEELFEAFEKEDKGLANPYLEPLACSTDKILLNKLLKRAISTDSSVRLQDSSSVFSTVYDTSPVGVECVMEFIKENYDKMLKYYKNVSTIKNIVSALGQRLSTDELRSKYDDLLVWLGKKEPSMNNSLKSYKNLADYEFNWFKQYVPGIFEWMDTEYPEKSQSDKLEKLFDELKYNIFISTPRFNGSNFPFDGRVEIEMRPLEKYMSRVVLHSHELAIKSIKVHEINGTELPVIKYLQKKPDQKIAIYLNSFIESKKIIVDIQFEGSLSDKMQGFYRSYYVNERGQTRWLGATQFQPTHARRAFPCFDEPAQKAVFVINIGRPADYHSLSNMKLKASVPAKDSKLVWDTFEKSPKMSTYLVAFIVSDFKPLRTSNEIVNIWGRSEIVKNGSLAEIAALRILEYVERETGVPRESFLPKLDLVGIPDFSAGGMENWGLATFREYGVFFDKNVTSARYENALLSIVAHEITHMWFGNLLTCDWWEHIWLNEGFAQYMEYRFANEFRKSHRFNDIFGVHELQVAMQTDALGSSHPMNNPVSTLSEISAVFDKITYSKSASVLHMLRSSVGEKVFQRAIKIYFEKNQFASVAPKNLWQAFDKAIEEINGIQDVYGSVENLMDSWTNKPGFPVVNATLSVDSRGLKVLTLKQERFLINGSHIPMDYFHWIPITLQTPNNNSNNLSNGSVLWIGRDQKIYREKWDDWFLLNVKQNGYYRVNYDRDSWTSLIKALNTEGHSSIHVTNRAQIIDDLFNLARADYIKYGLALSSLKYLIKEKEYPPWKAFFNALDFVGQRFEGLSTRPTLQFGIKLLTFDMSEELGFEDRSNDSQFDKLNRELILSWSCKYENRECVKKSKTLFSTWRRGGDSKAISPNARLPVYCTAIREGGESEWNFLWDAYQKADFESEKRVMLDGLGCTKDKKLLEKYIELVLNSTETLLIRKQDVSTVFASIYNAGVVGVDTMLEYLIENYEKIYKFYGNWENVGSLFKSIGSRISKPSQIEKLDAFYRAGNSTKIKEIVSDVRSAISTAETNHDWYKKHLKDLEEGLEQLNGGKNNVANSLSVFATSLGAILFYLLY